MKNVLILSSHNLNNLKKIISYFNSRNDIQVKLLCNNKNKKNIKDAKKLNIETYFIENDKLYSFFENRQFEIVAIDNFSQILNEELLNTSTFINIHSSLLPKYKGLNPIEKAYINNDFKTGITIHYVNSSLNEGEIIYQHEIDINPKWNIQKLNKEIEELKNYYYPRIIEKLLGLNVLIIGKSTKDGAIIEKIKNSKMLSKLYLANCNEFYSSDNEKIEFKNLKHLAKIAKEKNINLAIATNETLFKEGIVETFKKQNIKIIGIDKKTIELENNKTQIKKEVQKYNIKIAPYKKITNKKDIEKFLSYFKNPIIKTNGLSEGKGIYYNANIKKTENELFKYLTGKFDKNSTTSIIEEKLFGTKASFISFWDGKTTLHFPLCKTKKRNEEGLYASGLYTLCPFEISPKDELKVNLYKEKLDIFLKEKNYPNPFFLTSTFMISDDIYLLDFNINLIDTEAIAILNYIKNDWLEIFYHCANKMLNTITLIKNQNPQHALLMYSKGYPLKTRRNIKIENILPPTPDTKVYFSDIILKDGSFYSNDGLILCALAQDKNLIYKYFNQITFEEKKYIV